MYAIVLTIQNIFTIHLIAKPEGKATNLGAQAAERLYILEFNELNKINGVVTSGLSEAVGLARDPHEVH